jgi:hypothetical protein
MQVSKRLACGILLGLVALVASASPIPVSALGINKTVQMTGWPYHVSDGGGFSAVVNGYETTVWCVDDQDYINPWGQVYQANVTPLSAWSGGMNSEVRKGTNPNNNWGDGVTTLTPLQRYQGAAWLISQYSGFPAGPDINGASNLDLQEAAWRLTYMLGGPVGEGLPGANADYNAALAFLANPANAKYGFNRWAVISGPVDGRGGLLDPGTQTFLVQVQPTPEPGAFGLMGAGLAGVVFLLRRRKKA